MLGKILQRMMGWRGGCSVKRRTRHLWGKCSEITKCLSGLSWRMDSITIKRTITDRRVCKTPAYDTIIKTVSKFRPLQLPKNEAWRVSFYLKCSLIKKKEMWVLLAAEILGAATFSITTLSTMTLRIMSLFETLSITVSCVIMLSVPFFLLLCWVSLFLLSLCWVLQLNFLYLF